MPSLTPGNNPQQRSPKTGGSWGGRSKALSFWALVILVPIIFLKLSKGSTDQAPEIDYTAFTEQVDRNNVKSVVWAGTKLTGEFNAPIPAEKGRTAQKFTTILPFA